MPAQKEREDLWSHVYTMHARTCFRFGAVSSKQTVSLRSYSSAEHFRVHTYACRFPYVDCQIGLRLGHVNISCS